MVPWLKNLIHPPDEQVGAFDLGCSLAPNLSVHPHKAGGAASKMWVMTRFLRHRRNCVASKIVTTMRRDCRGSAVQSRDSRITAKLGLKFKDGRERVGNFANDRP